MESNPGRGRIESCCRDLQDLEAPPILDGVQRQLLVNCSLMAGTSAPVSLLQKLKPAEAYLASTTECYHRGRVTNLQCKAQGAPNAILSSNMQHPADPDLPQILQLLEDLSSERPKTGGDSAVVFAAV